MVSYNELLSYTFWFGTFLILTNKTTAPAVMHSLLLLSGTYLFTVFLVWAVLRGRFNGFCIDVMNHTQRNTCFPNILIGCGASFVWWTGVLLFFETASHPVAWNLCHGFIGLELSIMMILFFLKRRAFVGFLAQLLSGQVVFFSSVIYVVSAWNPKIQSFIIYLLIVPVISASLLSGMCFLRRRRDWRKEGVQVF
jgi:hypothetical protein